MDREHQLQASCLRWYNMQHKDRLIYAIPNAAKRSLRMGAYMKAEGLSAGVPDLCIPEPMDECHGLYIEMKVKGGSVRSSQKDWLSSLSVRGYKVAVCWTFEEFVDIVNAYFHEKENSTPFPMRRSTTLI